MIKATDEQNTSGASAPAPTIEADIAALRAQVSELETRVQRLEEELAAMSTLDNTSTDNFDLFEKQLHFALGRLGVDPKSIK